MNLPLVLPGVVGAALFEFDKFDDCGDCGTAASELGASVAVGEANVGVLAANTNKKQCLDKFHSTNKKKQKKSSV